MNDYLSLNDDTQAASDDYLGGDWGMEPAAQPAAGDPYAQQPQDPYMAGGTQVAEQEYLGADPYAQQQGFETPAYDQQYDAGFQLEPQQTATGGYAAPAAAPANPGMTGELSVQAPYLEEVQPGARGVGGARGDLSSLVLDVEVPVEVCFGDAALTVEEFLELGRGSVVELERSIEAPIELRVRGKLVARGQLVTINGNYGLRITDMVEEQ